MKRLLFFSLILCSCDQEPRPLARVGSEIVTQAELELEVLHTSAGDDRKKRALEQLLDRKRLVAEARATGLSEEATTKRAVDSVLIRRLQEVRLQPQIDSLSVTEAELQKRYDADATRWKKHGSTTLAVLFLASNPEDNVRRETNRRQLQEVQAEVLKMDPTKGFGALAVKLSEHTESRYRGGLLAPMSEQDSQEGWRRDLLLASKDLTAGALTDILEKEEGLYLARVVEREAPRQLSFQEVRHQLQRSYLQEAEERVREQQRAELRSRHREEVNQELLDHLPSTFATSPTESIPPSIP